MFTLSYGTSVYMYMYMYIVHVHLCIYAWVYGDGNTRSAVEQLGGLIQDHVSCLHDDIVFVILVVQNQKRPILVDFLIHIDDGGDDVSIHSIHVHT